MTQDTKSAVRASQTYELRLQIAIKSVQAEVTNVVEQISAWLGKHGVEESVVSELELVLAEALNNVVEHAYLYSEDGEIDILVTLTPTDLKTRITDSGRTFDGPPPFKEMDLENCAFEELPEGGFGWNLIRTLTDDVEFERAEDQNRLTLTRNLRVDLSEQDEKAAMACDVGTGIGMGFSNRMVGPMLALCRSYCVRWRVVIEAEGPRQKGRTASLHER